MIFEVKAKIRKKAKNNLFIVDGFEPAH